ncbi:hypothetical protein TRICHSKD4_3327 [Roseibium sp. TrichSKD4]|nr:hypothetical protein TRICHSKD4_3327 [Roseibium sp. TrichSKD4]
MNEYVSSDKTKSTSSLSVSSEFFITVYKFRESADILSVSIPIPFGHFIRVDSIQLH